MPHGPRRKRTSPQRSKGGILALCLLSLGVAACDELDLIEVRNGSVNVLLEFVPDMPEELAFSPADFAVEEIEVETRDGFTGEVVAEGVIDWDPSNGHPRVRLRVEIERNGHRNLEGHMIFRAANDEVLWSGRFGGLMVTPAEEEVRVTVPMGRGDLSYLDIRSLSIVFPSFGPPPRFPRATVPSLQEGQSLSILVVTDGGPDSPKVFWFSSDPSVLSVDENGNITAIRPGEATITAIVGRHRASLSIRVTQRVDQVVVTPELVVLTALGTEAAFTAQVLDPRGDPVEGASVEWGSNSSILEAVGEGQFRAVARGDATVTAASGEVSGTATVRVEQEIARVTLSPEEWVADALGEQATFEARAVDSNDHEVVDAELVWTVDGDGVISLGEDGTATAEGTGTATVTVSSGEFSASATITVRQVVHEVRVTPAEMVFLPGQFGSVAVQLLDRNENPIPDEGRVTLRSTDIGVADVDPNGTVFANNTGNAEIVASADGVEGSARVIVDLPLPPSATGDIYVFNDWNIWDTGRNPAKLVQNLVKSANNDGTRVIWYCGRQPSGVPSGSFMFGGICASSITTSTGGGQFSGTANAIRDAGYTVEVIHDTPLTAIPDDVRVFWLWTPTEAFTAAEINVLKAFAARGGRIVWNADFRDDWYFTHKHQNIANPLLSALGSGVTSTGTLRNVSSVASSGFNDPSDPLLQGITSISFGAPGDMQVSAPGVALVTTPGGHVLVARGPVDVTPLSQSVVQEMPAILKSLAAPSAPVAPQALPPGCIPGLKCEP